MELSDDAIYVALTNDHLDAVTIMNKVRSPKAGAIVLFAGMLRGKYGGRL
jgi:molybdopterin synthase catalytic subunit